MLSLVLTLWWGLTPPPAIDPLPPIQERGLATGYAAWKKEYMTIRGRKVKVSTGKPYCWWYRKVKRGDPIVAHRSLPCGTRVYVQVAGTDRGAWLTVGDRGPYGACIHKKDLPRGVTWKPSPWCRKKYGRRWVWYVKKRPRWPGIYRGVMDISHTARRIIGHSGFQHVIIRYWKPPKPVS